jgi:hypothetical protein
MYDAFCGRQIPSRGMKKQIKTKLLVSRVILNEEVLLTYWTDR